MQDIRQVLDFWFSDEAKARWFDARDEFDQTVRRRFAELHAQAAAGGLKAWEDSAEGCLALCILLDQMSRNMFRGEARMFATDDRAMAVAEHALARRFDQELTPERKQFLYLPFMHSENLANQLRALALFEHAKLPEGRRYAEEHVAIIRRFGRFPHRNAALGRPSTPEEDAFVRERPESWGQKPAFSRWTETVGDRARAPMSLPAEQAEHPKADREEEPTGSGDAWRS